MHGHLFGSFNAQADLIATNLHYNDRDIVVDNDALVFFPLQNEHRFFLAADADQAQPNLPNYRGFDPFVKQGEAF